MNQARPNGVFIDWVDGNPVPRYAPPVTDLNMKEGLRSALSNRYRCMPNDPPEYEGLTCFEVLCDRFANEAAQGVERKAEFIFDRVIGKPTQRVEQKTDINLNIAQEYIQKRVEALKQIGVNLVPDDVIDVHVDEPQYDLLRGL